MPAQGKSATAERSQSGGSAALDRLRRGEITLDAYLDFRADESVKALEGSLPADRLRMIRDTMREQLATDPVLLAMIRGVTGTDPEGRTG
jgi:hypothetical protein